MNRTAKNISLLLLLFASTVFAQFKLELPESPVDSPWVKRFRVTGVKEWTQVDDVMVITAVNSTPIFVDVEYSLTPGQWTFTGPNGNYSIRVKLKDGQALTGAIILGTKPPVVITPPINPPITPPITPPVTPPPDDKKKVSRVTYVYEKDLNHVPTQVGAALNRINKDHAGLIVASDFEEDTTDGGGDTPEQYKVALDAARQVGLPALVVQAGSVVVRIVKNPTTQTEVINAIAP